MTGCGLFIEDEPARFIAFSIRSMSYVGLSIDGRRIEKAKDGRISFVFCFRVVSILDVTSNPVGFGKLDGVVIDGSLGTEWLLRIIVWLCDFLSGRNTIKLMKIAPLRPNLYKMSYGCSISFSDILMKLLDHTCIYTVLHIQLSFENLLRVSSENEKYTFQFWRISLTTVTVLPNHLKFTSWI